MRAIRAESGTSMIEVLVSLLIIVFGLLGLLGLQARAQVAELESYQRAQALIMIQDMVDRLNANRKAAGCYVFPNASSGNKPLGTGFGATPTCTSSSGTAALRAIADVDLAAWNNTLLGTGETKGGSSVGSIIGARGCVTYNSTTDLYRVAVAWQGMSGTKSPAAVDSLATCGLNLYHTSPNTDAMRREVGVYVKLASLL